VLHGHPRPSRPHAVGDGAPRPRRRLTVSRPPRRLKHSRCKAQVKGRAHPGPSPTTLTLRRTHRRPAPAASRSDRTRTSRAHAITNRSSYETRPVLVRHMRALGLTRRCLKKETTPGVSRTRLRHRRRPRRCRMRDRPRRNEERRNF
jgi:hypothetical protein